MRPDHPALTRSWRSLAAESLRLAAATRVTSGLVALLALAVPAVVLGATGLNIEGQGAILRRVDEAGSRILTIVSITSEPAIPASAVDRIAALEGIEWVVGLSPVFDVRTRGPSGGPTPLRSFRAVRAPISLSETTAPDGAYVSATSARRVGLAGAYSTLDPGSIPVVGWFEAGEPLRALEAFILVPREEEDLRLERVIVAAEEAGWVELSAANLGSMLGATTSQAVTVERSPALLQAREAVRDEVVRRDRTLLLALLVAAMAMASIVVFAGTIAARRDFGRRRALGATRSQLTALVMLGTMWPAIVGASLGALVGWAYLGSRLGRIPDWRFPVAIWILVSLAFVAASALPAAVAATRDPLRVLRVP